MLRRACHRQGRGQSRPGPRVVTARAASCHRQGRELSRPGSVSAAHAPERPCARGSDCAASPPWHELGGQEESAAKPADFFRFSGAAPSPPERRESPIATEARRMGAMLSRSGGAALGLTAALAPAISGGCVVRTGARSGSGGSALRTETGACSRATGSGAARRSLDRLGGGARSTRSRAHGRNHADAGQCQH